MYTIKLEILRGNFPDKSVDKSASITMDGLAIGGECKPFGGNRECNFVECSSKLTIKEIASNTGLISVSIRYGKKSEDCNCDRNTWNCKMSSTQTQDYPLKVDSVARITLYPKIHASGNLN